MQHKHPSAIDFAAIEIIERGEKVTKNDMIAMGNKLRGLGNTELADELDASLEHWDRNKIKVGKFAKTLESRIRDRGKRICGLPMAQALGITREGYQSLNKRFQGFRAEYETFYVNDIEVSPETMAQSTLTAEMQQIIQSTLTGPHIDELVEFYAPFNKTDHVRYANHIRSLGDAKRADLLDEYANIWGANEIALKDILDQIKAFFGDYDSRFRGTDMVDALQRIVDGLGIVVDNHKLLAKHCGALDSSPEEDQEMICGQRLQGSNSRR